MISIILDTAAGSSAIPSASNLQIIASIVCGGLGGAALTLIVTRIRASLQKMKCHYIDDDVITRIPIIDDQGSHQNRHSKHFKLINTTNKDIEKFRVIFEFDIQSEIISTTNYSKVGLNSFKGVVSRKRKNECSFTIKGFNRTEEIEFKFDIANIDISKDFLNVTEADCTGFKIVVRDKRKKHKKNHGKIVTKSQLINQDAS